MGGGAPPGVSCLTLGLPLGRSGTLPRELGGAPGSLGGPPPPKGAGAQERPPGGSIGALLGVESGGKKWLTKDIYYYNLQNI